MSDIDVPFTASEPFLPFRAPRAALGFASAARSTLVTTSIQSLRARGLGARYERLLPVTHCETLLTAVAGTWLPIDAACTHYAACDALELPLDEQLAIAMEVGDRVHGTFLGLLMKMARSGGATPWTALAQTSRLYDRLFCGGGVSVTCKGPKDARFELVGNPLCDIEYFRVGVRGVYLAALRLFCRRVVANELPRGHAASAMALHIAWA